MDIENLIKDTFTEHEHDTPDGEQVLAAARKRIDRRRAVSRPLAVGAGVALVALAAATVVVLNRTGDDAPGVEAASGSGTSAPVHVAAPAKPAIEGLAMPFSLGWLPAGKADYLAQRINTGASADKPNVPVYDGEYLLTITSGHQKLMVDVQEMRMMSPSEAAFKSGPGQDVTVAGRTGVESSKSDGPGGYELYLANPNGGSLYVNVAADPGSTASAQKLVDTGHKVAANVRFPGQTKVTPVFGLGHLPSSLHMCTFEVGQTGMGDKPAAGTAYSLDADCARGDSSVQVNTTDPQMVDGKAGRKVQGHETRFREESNGYRTLWILDAAHGAPIAVAGRMASAELYGIANHLVLPH